MQLLPEHGDVFANGLLEGALVRDPGWPRGALKVENPADGLPWLHRAEAAENGEGCVDVAVFDERREEQLVHGERQDAPVKGQWTRWICISCSLQPARI